MIFQDLAAKATGLGLSNATKDSREWLRIRAKAVMSPESKQKHILGVKERHRSKITIGRMYMFVYDAKTKDKLPFWDRFPLVFPFAPAEGGFYGINLHYLPYLLRARLFDALMKFANNERMDESTKLRMSYKLLSAAATNKWVAPCVKRYLYSHVRSKFISIPSTEWRIALFLPTEKFVGENKINVWKKSEKYK